MLVSQVGNAVAIPRSHSLFPHAGERDTFNECSHENFNQVFETNVFGPMLTYQNLSALVLRSSSRLFVTMSSIMGSTAKTGEGGCSDS